MPADSDLSVLEQTKRLQPLTRLPGFGERLLKPGAESEHAPRIGRWLSAIEQPFFIRASREIRSGPVGAKQHPAAAGALLDQGERKPAHIGGHVGPIAPAALLIDKIAAARRHAEQRHWLAWAGPGENDGEMRLGLHELVQRQWRRVHRTGERKIAPWPERQGGVLFRKQRRQRTITDRQRMAAAARLGLLRTGHIASPLLRSRQVDRQAVQRQSTDIVIQLNHRRRIFACDPDSHGGPFRQSLKAGVIGREIGDEAEHLLIAGRHRSETTGARRRLA